MQCRPVRLAFGRRSSQRQALGLATLPDSEGGKGEVEGEGDDRRIDVSTPLAAFAGVQFGSGHVTLRHPGHALVNGNR